MVKIIEELSNNRIKIASDAGKLLDIGAGAVEKLVISRAELEYVEEVDPVEKAK